MQPPEYDQYAQYEQYAGYTQDGQQQVCDLAFGFACRDARVWKGMPSLLSCNGAVTRPPGSWYHDSTITVGRLGGSTYAHWLSTDHNVICHASPTPYRPLHCACPPSCPLQSYSYHPNAVAGYQAPAATAATAAGAGGYYQADMNAGGEYTAADYQNGQYQNAQQYAQTGGAQMYTQAPGFAAVSAFNMQPEANTGLLSGAPNDQAGYQYQQGAGQQV